VVIDFLGISKESRTNVVAKAVTNKASTSEDGPLGSSQLCILKIGEKSRSQNKESCKTNANNTNLSG